MNKLDKDIIEKLAYRVAELGGRACMVEDVRDEIIASYYDVDIGRLLELEASRSGVKEPGKPLRFGSAFWCTRLLVSDRYCNLLAQKENLGLVIATLKLKRSVLSESRQHGGAISL